MDNYNHTVSGIYSELAIAEKTGRQLCDIGFLPEQIEIIKENTDIAAPAADASDKVLKEVVVDGAVGTVVGAGLFGIGHLALVGANISLFIASPLLGPLVMLGWGASIGGLLGAVAGATVDPSNDNGQAFVDLVKDALSHGDVVLIAHTTTVEETRLAQDTIRDSVNHPTDVSSQ